MSGSLPHGPTPPRGEDLPSDDGEPMETYRHRIQMELLADSLDDALAHRDDVFVAGNMGVYFSETQARRNDFRAPDVFVVLDTKRGERRSWVVWEEDGRTPDVVIELVSESTEATDRGPKKDIYARLLHVAVYVIYDPWSARLDAYRLDPAHRRYEPIAPDERGRIFVEALGLWLAVVPSTIRDMDAPWLRWIDAEDRILPYGREMRREAEEEARRAVEEARRAAEQQAHAAEQQVRAAEEQVRAAEEQARAAEDRARAAEEELARFRAAAKR